MPPLKPRNNIFYRNFPAFKSRVQNSITCCEPQTPFLPPFLVSSPSPLGYLYIFHTSLSFQKYISQSSSLLSNFFSTSVLSSSPTSFLPSSPLPYSPLFTPSLFSLSPSLYSHTFSLCFSSLYPPLFLNFCPLLPPSSNSFENSI